MIRFPAALALACLASPAMAAASLPPCPHPDCSLISAGTFAHNLSVGLTLLAFGFLAAALLLGLLRHTRTVGVVAAAILALALACALSSPALAVEVATVGDSAVIVPYGQWVVAFAEPLREVLATILIGLVSYVVARLGPIARMLVTKQLIEQTVHDWLDFGINSTRDAVKDKVLPVPVGSQVIAAALQRAIDRAKVPSISQWVMGQIGGPEEIAKKLFRKLKLEEGATADSVIGPALRKAGVPADRPNSAMTDRQGER